MNAAESTSPSRIFRFWVPLAATWLMMAAEGPFLAAVIARLDEPKYNLAAFGVAVAFGLIAEAPVIMMLSAATALVEGLSSFRRLRNFTWMLNGLMTAALILLLAPGVYRNVTTGWMGLPDEVARLTRGALLLMLPWPAAIGFRRFYQGLLIRDGRTRRVAYGTLVRLVAMAGCGLLLALATDWPGAWIGGASLAAGVLVEAAASRRMAARSIRDLVARAEAGDPGPDLAFDAILRFYLPLALTTTIAMAAHPMITFCVGRARAPIESLAVLPVVTGLLFVFRTVDLSFQDVAIALLARSERNLGPLARFAAGLALVTSTALAILAWTPLASRWFLDVAGLQPELAAFALLPLRILAPIPLLSMLISVQRAILVHERRTAPISWATAAELTGIGLTLAVTIAAWNWVGALAATAAILAGRASSNLVLARRCLDTANRWRAEGRLQQPVQGP